MENKFIEIELLGKLSNEGILDGVVEISEKMDGANMSFFRENEGDPLTFRSRRIELNEKTGYNGFYPGIQKVLEADMKDPFPHKKMFFGERMSKHVIHYGECPEFIGFAVMDLETGRYEADWMHHFIERAMPIVPYHIVENPTAEDLKKLINAKSAFGDAEAIAEGIVIKNYDKINQFGTQTFAKLVRAGFAEDSGRGKGYCVKKEEEEKFAKRFATPARVSKAVFRILEEKPNMQLDMPIMPFLVSETVNDILKEEILTIAKECKGEFNFRMFQKAVSNECRVTLQNMIVEQASA